MRHTCVKLGAIGVMLLAAGCQTMAPKDEAPPPPNPAFAGEMNKFNAQFPNEKATRYEEVSIRHNNEKKLDEKGNCHDKSKYPVTIVLVLDASGKVTDSMTDVDNGKAACFRDAYAGAQFPPPPMAPYRKAIKLR